MKSRKAIKHTAAVAAALLLAPLTAGAASVNVSGTGVIKEMVQASTGLDGLWVCQSMAGVKLTYIPTTPGATVEWSRYSALGGGYAEPVTPTTAYTLENPQGDMGYIIDEGTTRTCVWLVDYSQHRMEARSLTVAPEGRECSVTVLQLDGSAPAIVYYSVTGQSLTLGRGIKVAYNTLKLDEDSFVWQETATEAEFDAIAGTEVRVLAPLCGTAFTLTGDRFLEKWGEGLSVATGYVDAYAVEAATTAVQERRDVENEISQGTGSDPSVLGGSAPATVEFSAAVTDAAIFREWQFSRHQGFEDVDLRVAQLDYTHTFDELGTTYVRFVCDNADGTCIFEGPVYRVDIGESSLLCPNAFSPGSTPGVNDEWRVSYRSIVEFECSIFNRAGKKMITLTHPSQGWDGRYRGKLVPGGVYYYVLRARGADGKTYKLSGDINIVNFK